MAGRPNKPRRAIEAHRRALLSFYCHGRMHRDCFFLLIVPGWALDLVIKDGDTLTLDGTEFRLDGIDAPEKDQVCVDDKGDLWACGIEAHDHLAT